MTSVKRKAGDGDVVVEAQRDAKTGEITGHRLAKRTRGADNQLVVSSGRGDVTVRVADGPARTSALMAPTMLLSGHGAEVFCCAFSVGGDYIASGSKDKSVFLWNTYGDCANYGVLRGHGEAVLAVRWSGSGSSESGGAARVFGNEARVYTASADKTGCVWDAETQQSVKKLREHTDVVTCVAPVRRGVPLCVTASDDCRALLWDTRARASVVEFTDDYQLLACEFNDDATQLFVGGIGNVVTCYDVRRPDAALYALRGHTDTVTGIALSRDGRYLATNARDQTLRVWDVRSFVVGGDAATTTAAAGTTTAAAPAPSVSDGSHRHRSTLTGHTHDFQQNVLNVAWSSCGTRLSCGSADGIVHVWRWSSATGVGAPVYALPGHSGSVNAVAFHPTEPIIVSGASDKQLYLGELEPSAEAAAAAANVAKAAAATATTK